MKYLLLLAFLSVISIACSWSPTGGYAPGQVDCPDKSLVRAASDISATKKKNGLKAVTRLPMRI